MIAGRYQLGGALGHGGMAQVRAARDLACIGRSPSSWSTRRTAPDPAVRRRFVREARAAASFSHPNAVAVFDAGDADGYLYLVMELVEGRSLAERIGLEGALPVDDALDVVDDVLQALGAAHRAGIVHRDVKPGNVLLTHDGTAKLADFGIAKRIGDGDLTLAGQFIGTPEYLSPEQVTGAPVTPATDLYAAGVVLFEAIAGRPPFAAGSPLATALAHRDLAPPDLRSRRRGVPDHVAGAVARAMQKDPASRFSTAEEMRSALAGRVRRSWIAPAVVITRRATRRWWWLAAGVAAVVAGGVIALDAGSDPPGTSPSTVAAAPTTIVAATTVAPTTPTTTTTVAATTPPTAPPTAPVTVPTPAAVDDLLLLVDVAPVMFGERADEVRRELEQIAERGRRRDVERLQERVAEWREDGSLPGATAAIIEAVLADVPAPDERDDD